MVDYYVYITQSYLAVISFCDPQVKWPMTTLPEEMYIAMSNVRHFENLDSAKKYIADKVPRNKLLKIGMLDDFYSCVNRICKIP